MRILSFRLKENVSIQASKTVSRAVSSYDAAGRDFQGWSCELSASGTHLLLSAGEGLPLTLIPLTQVVFAQGEPLASTTSEARREADVAPTVRGASALKGRGGAL